MLTFFAVLDIETFPKVHFIAAAFEIGSKAFDTPADMIIFAVGADNDIGPGAAGKSFQEASRQQSALIGILSDAGQGFEGGDLRIEEDDRVIRGQTAQQGSGLVGNDRSDEQTGKLHRIKGCHSLRKRSPDITVELEALDAHPKRRELFLGFLNSGARDSPVARVFIR